MAGYGGALAALASQAAAPKANAPAFGVDVGKPPQMDGLPPPPTMTGKMPTGSVATSAKGAADAAVEALRECAGYYPALSSDAEAFISKIKDASRPKAAGSPGAPAQIGQPSPLGTPPPDPNPTELSGSPGSI